MADFPAVPVPTTDAGALYASVMALKQGYELLTGSRGSSDQSVLSIQSSIATLAAANNFWSNRANPIYAAYTAKNTDTGSTLVLGGGAFYTLTLGAASDYPSTFLAVIVNADTSRGKFIKNTGSGFVSRILWPGQSAIVFAQAGAWYWLPLSQRWVIPSSISMYVDISAGNDANDGLAAGAGNALATIQAAANAVYKFLDIGIYTVNIHVVGSPTESLTITGPWVGSGTVYVVGDNTTPSNVTWICATGSPNVYARTQGRLLISGFKFVNTLNAGLLADSGGTITVIINAEFGNCAGGHMVTSQFGSINAAAMSYTISDDGVSTDTPYHLQLAAFGAISNYSCTVTLVGTPNFSGAFAYAAGGFIYAVNNTYVNAATGSRYLIGQGGSMVAGVDPYFPGNIAGSGGTTAGGGYYT